MIDQMHHNCNNGVDFINSLQYIGGRQVVNFLRGPMNINQGTRGSLQKSHFKTDKFWGSIRVNLHQTTCWVYWE